MSAADVNPTTTDRPETLTTCSVGGREGGGGGGRERERERETMIIHD